MGKGGPPSQEHDVRIVYAKVLGAKILGVAVEGRTLVPGPTEAVVVGWGRIGEASDPSPRFDSSDSEAGEDAYPEFWHA